MFTCVEVTIKVLESLNPWIWVFLTFTSQSEDNLIEISFRCTIYNISWWLWLSGYSPPPPPPPPPPVPNCIHMSKGIALNKAETHIYTKLADTMTVTVCRHDSCLILHSSIWLISVLWLLSWPPLVTPVPPIHTRLLTSAIKDPTSSDLFICPLSCLSFLTQCTPHYTETKLPDHFDWCSSSNEAQEKKH